MADKETPAQRRERMYNEAVAADRMRNIQAEQAAAAPPPQPAPVQSPQAQRTTASTMQLVNAQARAQWMAEVESGATQLDFNSWWNLRQHAFRPNQ